MVKPSLACSGENVARQGALTVTILKRAPSGGSSPAGPAMAGFLAVSVPGSGCAPV